MRNLLQKIEYECKKKLVRTTDTVTRDQAELRTVFQKDGVGSLVWIDAGTI